MNVSFSDAAMESTVWRLTNWAQRSQLFGNSEMFECHIVRSRVAPPKVCQNPNNSENYTRNEAEKRRQRGAFSRTTAALG